MLKMKHFKALAIFLAIFANFSMVVSMDMNKEGKVQIIKSERALEINKLMTTLSTVGKEYSVSFDVKPTAFNPVWTNVIHFSIGGNFQRYGDRLPGVWFGTGLNSDTMHISSAINGKSNYYIDTKKKYPLNKWINVLISQTKFGEKYIYKIHIDGEEIFSIQNTKVQVFHNVKVFVSDNWYAAQPGFIRELSFSTNHESCSTVLIEEQKELKRNVLLATLSTVGKVYSVSFDIKPTAFLPVWTNVIHFSIGGNFQRYGDRLPAVWFGTGSNSDTMHISSAINGKSNYYIDTKKKYPKEKWINVLISQTKFGEKYVYKIHIDGEEIFSIQNTKVQVFHDVKVFVGDNWYAAQPGFIRELSFSTNHESCSTVLIGEQKQLERNVLLTTLSTVGKAYSVSFDVKPTTFLPVWTNVIHFSIGGNFQRYGDRLPAVWFGTGSNSDTMHISSAINGKSNYYIDTKKKYPKEKWINVLISQTKFGEKYVYKIHIDGEEIFSIQNTKVQEFHNVKVFVGDNWYAAQPGFIRELSFSTSHESCSTVLIGEQKQLKRNVLLTTLSTVGKVYSVSFDVKPTAFLPVWTNVIHFSIGGNFQRYGDRLPAVWFGTGSNSDTMHISSAINGKSNYYVDTKKKYPKEKWINVLISQTKFGEKYVYKIHIDGEETFSIQNTKVQEFHNVKVYVADNWYEAQPGFIRNLIINY